MAMCYSVIPLVWGGPEARGGGRENHWPGKGEPQKESAQKLTFKSPNSDREATFQ